MYKINVLRNMFIDIFMKKAISNLEINEEEHLQTSSLSLKKTILACHACLPFYKTFLLTLNVQIEATPNVKPQLIEEDG